MRAVVCAIERERKKRKRKQRSVTSCEGTSCAEPLQRPGSEPHFHCAHLHDLCFNCARLALPPGNSSFALAVPPRQPAFPLEFDPEGREVVPESTLQHLILGSKGTVAVSKYTETFESMCFYYTNAPGTDEVSLPAPARDAAPACSPSLMSLTLCSVPCLATLCSSSTSSLPASAWRIALSTTILLLASGCWPTAARC